MGKHSAPRNHVVPARLAMLTTATLITMAVSANHGVGNASADANADATATTNDDAATPTPKPVAAKVTRSVVSQVSAQRIREGASPGTSIRTRAVANNAKGEIGDTAKSDAGTGSTGLTGGIAPLAKALGSGSAGLGSGSASIGKAAKGIPEIGPIGEAIGAIAAALGTGSSGLASGSASVAPIGDALAKAVAQLLPPPPAPPAPAPKAKPKPKPKHAATDAVTPKQKSRHAATDAVTKPRHAAVDRAEAAQVVEAPDTDDATWAPLSLGPRV